MGAKSNGMCSATDFPYVCADPTATTCTSATCTKCTTPALKAGGWFKSGDVTSYAIVEQKEDELEAAVARQPISVAIEADQAVFQHYTGGVLTSDACGTKLDHGVLIVGYGSDAGQKYWKVKNSWGNTWGESGYIRIEKGDPATGGECGIREGAVFPTVQASAAELVV